MTSWVSRDTHRRLTLYVSADTRAETREHYLNASYGWKSWLLTTDHKRIALLYLFTVTLFFMVGGAVVGLYGLYKYLQ